MRLRDATILAGLALAATSTLRAQALRAVVRGGVVSAESGDRIPFALVILRPQFDRRFTAEDGTFAFADVAPGVVRLQVRQVGYQPWDTVLAVEAAQVAIRVELRRIAVQLAALTVAAEAVCTRPGPPATATEPDLASLFAELRQNAERYRLLADEYRFQYHVLRLITIERADGSSLALRPDTLERRSDDRWRYRPGRVATAAPRGRSRVVHLPELADLADSTFIAWHCFRYAGVDTLNDVALTRMDFSPSSDLRDPDVEGTAWLDARTYQLRQLAVRVTNASRIHGEIAALSATVWFDEALPSLALPVRLVALTTWVPRDDSPLTGQVEDQRRVALSFRRRPGTAP